MSSTKALALLCIPPNSTCSPSLLSGYASRIGTTIQLVVLACCKTKQPNKDPRLKYLPCIRFDSNEHDPGNTANRTRLSACDDFPSDSSSSNSSSSTSDSDSSSSSSSCHHQKCKSHSKKHKSKTQMLHDRQARHQKKVAKTTDFLFKCAKNWDIDELWYSHDMKSCSQAICRWTTKLQNLLDLHSQLHGLIKQPAMQVSFWSDRCTHEVKPWVPSSWHK